VQTSNTIILNAYGIRMALTPNEQTLAVSCLRDNDDNSSVLLVHHLDLAPHMAPLTHTHTDAKNAAQDNMDDMHIQRLYTACKMANRYVFGKCWRVHAFVFLLVIAHIHTHTCLCLTILSLAGQFSLASHKRTHKNTNSNNNTHTHTHTPEQSTHNRTLHIPYTMLRPANQLSLLSLSHSHTLFKSLKTNGASSLLLCRGVETSIFADTAHVHTDTDAITIRIAHEEGCYVFDIQSECEGVSVLREIAEFNALLRQFERHYERAHRSASSSHTHSHTEGTTVRFQLTDRERTAVRDAGGVCTNERCVFRFEESFIDDGFIKEPAWSKTGAYIASPYHRGMRVFGVPTQAEIERTNGKTFGSRRNRAYLCEHPCNSYSHCAHTRVGPWRFRWNYNDNNNSTNNDEKKQHKKRKYYYRVNKRSASLHARRVQLRADAHTQNKYTKTTTIRSKDVKTRNNHTHSSCSHTTTTHKPSTTRTTRTTHMNPKHTVRKSARTHTSVTTSTSRTRSLKRKAHVFAPKQPLSVRAMKPHKCVRPLINTHRGNTLTCSFHPFYPMIASGGSGGVVNLYAPRM